MTLPTRISGILAVALMGCQDSEYTTPDEPNTGTPPRAAGTVYEFRADRAPTYLGANLEHSNAVTAEFVNTGAGITTMPVNGLQPDFAGAEANLLGGVGFGTYANPDYRQPVTWETAGDFKAVVTAELAFTSPGDSVLICRSFATTCVELIAEGGAPGVNLAIIRAAANIPDTEIGEISPGVSAAVRGTGDSGLTIALTDPTLVAQTFGGAAGTPFTVVWTTGRGATEGSLDWSLAITTAGGTVTADGNTTTDMAAAIVKTGGVGLIFDTPLGSDETWPPYAIDYEYEFDGEMNGNFQNTLPGSSVDLSPQFGLAFAPLYVYATVDPANQFATYSGFDGTPHAVQDIDGLLGAAVAPEGSSNQTFVYSVAFEGDDFDITTGADLYQGLVDWGTTGGGFYPSPAFAYSQTLLGVQAKVGAQVKKGIHRFLYAQMAASVAQADASLPALVGAMNGSFSQSLTYTDLATADFITIGTDFADSNIDAQISTSCEDTYTTALNVAVSTTFRTQFNAVIAAMEANSNQILTGLINANAMDMDDYLGLKLLQLFLTAPPGMKDGTVDDELDPIFDTTDPYPSGPCSGFDCIVGLITYDIATGNNYSGANTAGLGRPGLAVVTLWGVAPSAAVDAQVATFGPNLGSDHPAYAAIPAAPATPPVREVAAASMNGLVMGVYGNFQSAVFGPGVPASNFSLGMGAGNPAAASGPILTSLTITDGTAAPAE